MSTEPNNVVIIRRTRNADPQGSEVYVDGVKIPRPASVDWHITPNDADLVTVTFKGLVRVEFFDAPNYKREE